MTKRLEMDIETCLECPYSHIYRDWGLDCFHGDIGVNHLWAWKGDPKEGIPDWCPLPDGEGK